MKLKLGRAATLIDKYGIYHGVRIYFQLKLNRVSSVKVPGIKSMIEMRKNSSDVAVFEQVFVRGDYEMQIPFTPKVIIDAGANIGLFSVIMKSRFPDATVICIEPAKDNCELLKKNLSTYDNIHIECAGLWHSDAKLNIIDKYNMGYPELVVEESYNDGTVPAVTVDAITRKYNITQIDVLKIDIEGSEEAVFLKNYEQWLPKVKMVIIEFHDWLKPGCSGPFFEAIQKTFRQYTYTVWSENTIIENKDLS